MKKRERPKQKMQRYLTGINEMSEYIELITRQMVRQTDAVQEHFARQQETDELEKLSAGLNFMTDQMIWQIRELENHALERERGQAELELARQIRSDMMPMEFPAYPERTEFDVLAGIAAESTKIGGEFYDFFPIEGNRLALMAGATTETGVPAALYMVKAKTLLEHYIRQGWQPQQVLTETNSRMAGTGRSRICMTGFIGVLHLDSGLFEFANAEQEGVWKTGTDGNIDPVKYEKGVLLGGLPGVQYHQEGIQLGRGEQLFFYSDDQLQADISERARHVWMRVKYQ